MKELKNNVNTLLWLMVTLSLLVMFSLVCLSSCNSSVQNGNEVTVRVASDLKNGKIDSIKVNNVDFSNKKEFTVKYNDVIEFKAKPDDGYKVVKWTPEILKVSDDKLTAKMIVTKDMKDLTVSVKFEKKDNNPPGPNEKESLTVDAIRKELMVTDDTYNTPIFTSLLGLGLTKEGSQFKYQLFSKDGKTVTIKTGNDLREMIGSTDYVEQSGGPNLGDEFKTLPSILDAKWNFAKNSEKIVPKEFKMLTFNNAAGRNERPSVVGLYELVGSDYYISYRNGEMYVEVANTTTHYFADWTFAFVNESKPNEVYVFSVGEIESKSETDMKIKPYILRDLHTLKDKYRFLPDLEDRDDFQYDSKGNKVGMKLCRTYRFSLSALLNRYLQQISDLEKWNEKYKDFDKKVIPSLSEEFVVKMLKLEDCDVYMTIGAQIYQNDNMFSTRTNFKECWRNVLKLTEHEFWDKCFTN